VIVIVRLLYCLKRLLAQSNRII